MLWNYIFVTFGDHYPLFTLETPGNRKPSHASLPENSVQTPYRDTLIINRVKTRKQKVTPLLSHCMLLRLGGPSVLQRPPLLETFSGVSGVARASGLSAVSSIRFGVANRLFHGSNGFVGELSILEH